jgi:hypothetical protein
VQGQEVGVEISARRLPLALRRWAAESPQPAWLFGGAVRDLMLKKKPTDWDVAVAGSAEAASRDLAKAATWICLNADFQQFRVVKGRGARLVIYDVQPVPGDAINVFLLSRDYSVNSLAIRLPVRGQNQHLPVLDPNGGWPDLRSRKLRALPDAFAADPIRGLRGLRLAMELNLTVTPELLRQIRATRQGLKTCAPERVRDELFRMLVFWPGQQALILSALELVLGPWRGRRERLRRLNLKSIPQQQKPFLLFAAGMKDPSGQGRAWRLSRREIRFLEKWQALRSLKQAARSPRDWLWALAETHEDPVVLSRLAVAAGTPALRKQAQACRACSQRLGIGPRLVSGGEAARWSGKTGPDLGLLLTELQVEQALGRIKTRSQARAWIKERFWVSS